MAFFSTDTDLWSPDDFARLAETAGLVMGDVLDRPRGTRPDAVDMSITSTPWWKLILAFVVVPILVAATLVLFIKAL
jgi:hypothetical protein